MDEKDFRTSGSNTARVSETPPAKGIIPTIGEALYGTENWERMTTPRPTRSSRAFPYVLTLVGLVAAFLMILTVVIIDDLNAIPVSILALCATTVWTALYLSRR